MKNYININGQKIDFSKQELLDCLVSLISYSNSLRRQGLVHSANLYGRLYDKLDPFYSSLTDLKSEAGIKDYFFSIGIVPDEIYEFEDRFLIFVGLENNLVSPYFSKVEKLGNKICATINK